MICDWCESETDEIVIDFDDLVFCSEDCKEKYGECLDFIAEHSVTLLPNKRLEPTPGFGQLKQPEQTN